MTFTDADKRHLEAAQGWIELGNHFEANEELENITAQLREHPDVLEIRWQIYAKAGKWDACLDLGAAQVKLAPTKPASWLQHACALHKLGRTEEALEALQSTLYRFHTDWQVLYDLARYACVLGKLREARVWLNCAFDYGWKKASLAALDDPNLALIWRGTWITPAN
jgi:predicted Zn-dependent protease